MTPNEYQEAALKTANEAYASRIASALSLAGEVGEYVDIVKKLAFHNPSKEKYDSLKDKIPDELGDIAWSLALACHVNGYTLEEIMQRNIRKLQERHPNGYSPEYMDKKLPETVAQSKYITNFPNVCNHCDHAPCCCGRGPK